MKGDLIQAKFEKRGDIFGRNGWMHSLTHDKILRFTQDDRRFVILNEVKNLGVGGKDR